MILNEFESKGLLKQADIDVVKGHFIPVNELNESLMSKMQIPDFNSYVIKIVSKDIPHKSNVGGVILNVPRNKIRTEISDMISNIREKMPGANIEGVYIQEMLVRPGIECIIGIKEDLQFGKIIMFGLGGIYAEIFKDISMRVLPVTESEIHQMITETKVYKILNGYRGKQYDIKAICYTLMRVSLLASSQDIKELDINPLMVYEKGVKVLDARIMLTSECSSDDIRWLYLEDGRDAL